MSEEIREMESIVEESKDNEEVGAAATEETAGAQGEKADRKEKKYTDDDVDRIVSRKIARERERMQKLFNEEQEVSEIEQREQKVLMREMKADAKDMLIDRGLPSSLSELLNYESKEDMTRSMDEVETVFREAVEREIKLRLKGSVPKAGSGYKPGSDALRDAFRP